MSAEDPLKPKIVEPNIDTRYIDMAEGKKPPSFETIATFSIPGQTTELDFQKLLGEPLFHRSFYLTVPVGQSGELFHKLVLATSVPFNGTKGREYQELRRLTDEKDKEVMAELSIEPISLNEWRYLFSQLTEQQLTPTGGQSPQGGIELSRDTTFYVKFDDGQVRVIRTSFDKSAGGPYGYSLSVYELDTEQYLILKNTKVISTTKRESQLSTGPRL